MASTKSGSRQILEIADAGTSNFQQLSGNESGFEGFTLTPTQGSYQRVTAGRMLNRKSGHTTHAGSFTVAETQWSMPHLLGRNGRRCTLRWSKQGTSTGSEYKQFDAILNITRTANERAGRDFSVEVMVDGTITNGTHS